MFFTVNLRVTCLKFILADSMWPCLLHTCSKCRFLLHVPRLVMSKYSRTVQVIMLRNLIIPRLCFHIKILWYSFWWKLSCFYYQLSCISKLKLDVICKYFLSFVMWIFSIERCTWIELAKIWTLVNNDLKSFFN
jgi:hypothetical protein